MRRRYLALKIECTQKIDEEDLKTAVWNAVSRLFGEYGASRAGLVLIEYDETKNYAVWRCENVALELARASLASITEINSKPAMIHVSGVSGTLKSLRRNLHPDNI